MVTAPPGILVTGNLFELSGIFAVVTVDLREGGDDNGSGRGGVLDTL